MNKRKVITVNCELPFYKHQTAKYLLFMYRNILIFVKLKIYLQEVRKM